ncbi:hypothetical protein ACFX15_039401 [Malus domestica]
MNPNFQGRVPPAKLAMYASSNTSSSPPWLFDSEASSHMTNNIHNLQNPRPYTGPDKVYIGDGQGLPILHTGSTLLKTPSANFQLKNVLHVPQLKHDLLSANMFLRDNWCLLTVNPFDFNVKDLTTGRMLFRAPVSCGLYPFSASSTATKIHAHSAIRTSSHVWHQRLGHPTFKTFRSLLSKSSLPISNIVQQLFCSNCVLGKCAKLPFQDSLCTTSRSLELVHADVWVPAPVCSISGYRFYVIFVDDFTKYTWLYPLKHKSEVFPIFVQFQALVKNLSRHKIGTLRSDSGCEFISSNFKHHLSLHGIQQQLSCPYTPQQNGCAERKHKHIVETARTLLIASQVPHQFWVEAFLTAMYLINRLPPVNKSSPWEQFFRKVPDYNSLRVFGCQCFPWLKPYTNSKLEPKSKMCVFIGYSLAHKGYRCLDPFTNRVYLSRHVHFDEQTFPFHDPYLFKSSPLNTTKVYSPFSLTFPNVFSFTPPHSPIPPPIPSSHTQPAPLSSHASFTAPSSPSSSHSSHLQVPEPHPVPLVSSVHLMQTRSKSGIYKPKAFTVAKHHVPSHLDNDFIPTTYIQASKHPQWRAAMQDEFNALQNTRTWQLVSSTSTHNLVGCKWVFQIKRKPDGYVDRYKARLVAKGYNQQKGIDYSDTFSPVAKPVTIRLILTLAVQSNWFLHQLDINNAFLHGHLKENVYMAQPTGFIDQDNPTHVCHLKKSLYGLKQAPRAWYEKLQSAIFSMGFKASHSDHSFFVLHNPILVLVLVYVDDIIVIGPSSIVCHNIISQLSSQFPIKDLGDLHYFLGLEVQKSTTGAFIHQSKYILDLLKRTKMDGAKPCATPLSSAKLDHTGSLLSNPKEYRSIVGALQYLTWTRPDLSFAVNLVCQFMHYPREPHLQAVKLILWYLKGTLGYGLWFPKTTFPLLLKVFSDADGAGCSWDRRSTGGFCIFLGSCLVSLSAKKQHTVARSSTEAEYRSLAHTLAEITWICQLLTDIGFQLPSLPQIWCDNVSAIALASNPVFHARTKHVEIDYHYIRELVLAKLLTVQIVCSAD